MQKITPSGALSIMASPLLDRCANLLGSEGKVSGAVREISSRMSAAQQRFRACLREQLAHFQRARESSRSRSSALK